MPLVDLNDPVHLGINVGAEGQWGHPNTRPEVRLTYSRVHVLPELRRRWAWLVPALGLTPTSSIALLGCAYGYSLEVLAADHNITRVVGTETASGIRTKMGQSEDADIQAAIEAVGLSVASGDGLRLFNALRDRAGLVRSTRTADVLNESLANNPSRNRLRDALLAKGGTSWDVVSENVLTVLTDSECQTFATQARAVRGITRLIHLVSTARIKAGERSDLIAGYNSKTAMEWKALLPDDTIVSLYTREIL
jgi:hypothetical protein